MPKLRAGALALALLLANCTTPAVRSEMVGARGSRASHITYAVPRGILFADVVAWSPSRFGILVYQPVMMPDPRLGFSARLSHSAFSDDAMRISVDPATRLLTGLNVVVEDRRVDVARQVAGTVAAGGAGGFERSLFTGVLSAPTGPPTAPANRCTAVFEAPVILTRVQFDPLSAQGVDEAVRQVRTAVRNFDAAARPACLTSEQIDEASIVVREFDAVGATSPITAQPLDIHALQAACARGLCTPVLRSFEIEVRAPNGEPQTGLVNLPDARTMAVVPVERGLFTRRTTEATFAAGLVQDSATTQPSEALAVASVPLTIVRAALGTVTEVFQLRVNVNAGQRNVASNAAGASAATAAVLAPNGTVSAPNNPRGTGAYMPPSGFAPTPSTVFMVAASRDVSFSTVRAALEKDKGQE